jgi:hypothetical protein
MVVHQSKYFFGNTNNVKINYVIVNVSCFLLINSVHQLICFSYVVSFQNLVDPLDVYGGMRLYQLLLLEQNLTTRLPTYLLC